MTRALHGDERKMVAVATRASRQGTSARSLQEKISCPIRKSAQLGRLLQSPSRATDMLCAAGDPDRVEAPTPATENAPSSTCESASPCWILSASAGATTVYLRALAALPLPRAPRRPLCVRGKLVRAYGRPTGRLPSSFAILPLPMNTAGEVQHNAPSQMKVDYLCLCSSASGNPAFIRCSVFSPKR